VGPLKLLVLDLPTEFSREFLSLSLTSSLYFPLCWPMRRTCLGRHGFQVAPASCAVKFRRVLGFRSHGARCCCLRISSESQLLLSRPCRLIELGGTRCEQFLAGCRSFVCWGHCQQCLAVALLQGVGFKDSESSTVMIAKHVVCEIQLFVLGLFVSRGPHRSISRTTLQIPATAAYDRNFPTYFLLFCHKLSRSLLQATRPINQPGHNTPE
jgi:hypothetical protein